MKRLLALMLVATLAACGADGEPVTPTAQTTITGSSSGVQVAQRVGVRRGPLSVTLGLGV